MSLQHCLVLTVATGAVWMDLRTRRIANEWIITAWIAGLVTQLIRYGAAGAGIFLFGMLFPILALYILFYFHMLGAGDIKLLSAVGGFLGVPAILKCMIVSFLSGAVLSIGIILVCGNLPQRLTKFSIISKLILPKENTRKNRAGSLLRWEVGHGVHPFFRSRADGSAALDWGILLNTAKKKSVFAVCDTEMEYARNFMEYLNQKRNIPFEVHAFSSAEMFLEFAKTTKQRFF